VVLILAMKFAVLIFVMKSNGTIILHLYCLKFAAPIIDTLWFLVDSKLTGFYHLFKKHTFNF